METKEMTATDLAAGLLAKADQIMVEARAKVAVLVRAAEALTGSSLASQPDASNGHTLQPVKKLLEPPTKQPDPPTNALDSPIKPADAVGTLRQRAPAAEPKPLTLEALHAEVPREKWVKMAWLTWKLGTTKEVIVQTMAHPDCGVWMPTKSRVAWKPALMLRPEARLRLRNPRKLAPDPTFPFPPRIGFPSERREKSDEWDIPPMHKKAVEAGRTLLDPWSLTDVMARVGGDMDMAKQWVIAWLEVEWIKPSGFGLYRKTAKFGESHEPDDSPSCIKPA